MPTTRQKLALKNLGKYGTEEKALLSAGYSPSYAKKGGIKKTTGWQTLLSKYLNDEDLAKKHEEQLNATKNRKLYFDIDDDDELIESVCKKMGVELLYIKVNRDQTGKTANVLVQDFMWRDMALDKAYKVKGLYALDGKQFNPVVILNITSDIAGKYTGNIIESTPSTEHNS